MTEDILLCGAGSFGVSLSSTFRESSSLSFPIASDQSCGKTMNACNSERTFAIKTNSENNDSGTKLFNATAVYALDSQVDSSLVDPETVVNDTVVHSGIISGPTLSEAQNRVCLDTDISTMSNKDCSGVDSDKEATSGHVECQEHSVPVDVSACSPRCVFAIGCSEFFHDSFSVDIPLTSNAGHEAALCSDIISASDVGGTFLETEEKTLIDDGGRSGDEDNTLCITGARQANGNNDGNDLATAKDETDASDDDLDCKRRDDAAVLCTNDAHEPDVESSAADEEENGSSEVDKFELPCSAEDYVNAAGSHNDSDTNSWLNCAVEDCASPEKDFIDTQTVDSRSDCIASDAASIRRCENDSKTTETVDSRSDQVASTAASIVRCENDSNAAEELYIERCIWGNEGHLTPDLHTNGQLSEDEDIAAVGVYIATENGEVSVMAVQPGMPCAILDVSKMTATTDGAIGCVIMDSKEVHEVSADICNDECKNEAVSTVAIDLKKASNALFASKCDESADLKKASDSVIDKECDESVVAVDVDLEIGSDSVIASEYDDKANDAVSVNFEKASDIMTMSSCNDEALYSGVDDTSAIMIARLCDEEVTGHVNVALDKTSGDCSACEYDGEAINSVVMYTEKFADNFVASAWVDEAVVSSAVGSENVLENIITGACCTASLNSVSVDFEKDSDSIVAVECDTGAAGSSSVATGSKSKTSSQLVDESHFDHPCESSGGCLTCTHALADAVHQNQESSNVLTSQSNCFCENERDTVELIELVVDEGSGGDSPIEQGLSLPTVLAEPESVPTVLAEPKSVPSTESVQCIEAFDSVQNSEHSSQVAASCVLTVPTVIISGGQNLQEYSSDSAVHSREFDSVKDSGHSSLVAIPTVVCSGLSAQQEFSLPFNLKLCSYAVDTVEDSGQCSRLVTGPVPVPTGLVEPESVGTILAEPESVPTILAELESVPTILDEPESVPIGLAEPESLPKILAEPESLPTVIAEPESIPTILDEPESMPTGLAEPGSLPTVLAEPESVPKDLAEPESLPTVLAEPESTSSSTGQDLCEKSRRDQVRTEEAVGTTVHSEDCMCLEVSSTSDDPAAGVTEVPALGRTVLGNEGSAVPMPDFAADEELDIETYTEEEPERLSVDKEPDDPCGCKEIMPEEADTCLYCSFNCADKEKMLQHLQQVHGMEFTNSSQHSTVLDMDVESPGSRVATESPVEGYDLRTVKVIVIEPNNNFDRTERKRRHSLSTDDSDSPRPDPARHPCRVAAPSDGEEDDVIFVREEKRTPNVSHSSTTIMHQLLSSENNFVASDSSLTKLDTDDPSFATSSADSGVDTESVVRRLYEGFLASEKEATRGQDAVLQEQPGQLQSSLMEASFGVPVVDPVHRMRGHPEPFLSDASSNRSLDAMNASLWNPSAVNYAYVTRSICRPIMSTMTLDPVPPQCQADVAPSLGTRQRQGSTTEPGYHGRAPNVFVPVATGTCDRNPQHPMATRVVGPPPLMHISELQMQGNSSAGSRLYPQAVGQNPGDPVSKNPSTRPMDTRVDFGSIPLVDNWSNFLARTARAPASEVSNSARFLPNSRAEAARSPGDLHGDHTARPLAHGGGLNSRSLDDNRANHASRHASINPLINSRADRVTKHLVDNRSKLATRPAGGNRADHAVRHFPENRGAFANGPLADNPASHLTRPLLDSRGDFPPSVDNRCNPAARQPADNRRDVSMGRAMVPPPAHSKLPARQNPMHGSSFLPANVRPCAPDNASIPYDLYNRSSMPTHMYPAHLQALNSGGIFQGTVVRGEKPLPAHLPQRRQAHMPPNMPLAHGYLRPSHGAFEPHHVRQLEAVASSTNSCLLCSFQAPDRWSLYNHILTHSLPDHGN